MNKFDNCIKYFTENNLEGHKNSIFILETYQEKNCNFVSVIFVYFILGNRLKYMD